MRRPVLIVDDEEFNIEAIRNYLDMCGVPCAYSPTIAEAASMIYDRTEATQNSLTKLPLDEREFGAIVLDNHFTDNDLVAYDPNFNGIDLAIILAGKRHLFRPGHERFITDLFGELYEPIVERYKNRVVFFSGSARTESRARPDLFSGFSIADKFPDNSRSTAEDSLLSILEDDLGYSFDECRGKIRAYKSLHGLSRGNLDY